MAFTQRQLDELVTWAGDTIELARERTAARNTFFGEDDLRPIKYWGGAEDATSRRRRFLGYFLFTYRLEDGRSPAEVGVVSLFQGREQEDALRAVRGARYVMASVRSVLPGRAVFLTLEQERFEVPHREWSLRLSPGATVYTYLLPIRRGIWLPGPGWLEMPIRLGPGIQAHLHDLQPDPIGTERLLQNRGAEEAERRPKPPQDETLEDAVARMTAAAEEAGKERLVLSPAVWAVLVQQYMANPDPMAFSYEIIERVGAVEDVDELDRWLALAHNIWNNTPQPDRGGKSPNELAHEE